MDFSPLCVARKEGKREHTLDWAAAQLDWPTLSNTEVFSALSNTEVFSATKKHIFSVEILIGDIAADVAFRQQTSLDRDTKKEINCNLQVKEMSLKSGL